MQKINEKKKKAKDIFHTVRNPCKNSLKVIHYLERTILKCCF